ncbi:J domain-containing protein [Limnofasciculus baicalensis]|uniref:DnaJ domain-containing protein n=1 Tax=Limnofasciculus baicalensis BBK-W-15 TaxID=2699891 RepID=A0AAE3GVV6_9CYAN|nr:DnaJ domain-containing protein [Limnofasciculus baicalensis]MCP2731636.1 DnaJ domain-containing protein [Limnofasciculus baicalensis BBK-W-15]
MPQSPNYYNILEISRNATSGEIKKAYRRLARQYHPDLHPENPAAVERFKAICQAYQILSNPEDRSQYDREFNYNRSETKTPGMTAQDFYIRAVSKGIDKDYQGAIKDCTRAIEINPNFVEAYVERGTSRYKLGDARATLQDCTQALSINPKFAPAYYYQGKARYRLGYTQAAISAYTQAIDHNSNYPESYYYRGSANIDLKEYDLAVADLTKATELFNAQGDKTSYQLAREALKSLNQNLAKQNPAIILKTAIADGLGAFVSCGLNPVGGLYPTFTRFTQERAVAVGIVLAAIFDICFVSGVYAGWRDLFQVSIIKLIFVGIVPFIALTIISAIARLLFRCHGSLAGDIFLAGAALMPLSILAVASGISTQLGSHIMIIITVFCSCYTILLLYGGCTQISNLSEITAALLVPAMILATGWISYWSFIVMLGT